MNSAKTCPGGYPPSPVSSAPLQQFEKGIPGKPVRGMKTVQRSYQPKCQPLDDSPTPKSRNTLGLSSSRLDSTPSNRTSSAPSVLNQANNSPDTSEPQPHSTEQRHSPSRTSFNEPQTTHNRLRTTLHQRLTPSDQKGVIYILRDPKRPQFGYKIGLTTKSMADRLKQHENCCNYTPEVIHVSAKDIPHCQRVEALIHRDLAHLYQPRICSKAPTAGHTEWFSVDEQMAKATVKRWEQFMEKQKPYSWSGSLGIVWRYVLEQRSDLRDIHILTHEELHEQWRNKILVPPTAEEVCNAYLSYVSSLAKATHCFATTLYTYSRMFFWQLSSILYGLCTMFLYQNRATLYVFVVILSCATVTVVSKVPLEDFSKKTSRTTPKKKVQTASGENMTGDGDEENVL